MRSKLLTCRIVTFFILLATAVILAPGKQVHASSLQEIIKVSGKSPRGDRLQAQQGKAGSVIRPEKGPRYRDGEVLVKFKASITESAKAGKHRRLQATLVRDHKALRLQRVALKKGMTVDEAIAQYQRDPDVEYAEPNYLVTLLNTPNDWQYGELWGLAKIKAPQAWDITTGDSNAVIAILDTGIDYSHPDLIGNLWTNPGEVNGQPDVDNDGNGYPNDLYGYNAIDNNGDPSDSHYHGTHVAGTIGAVGNNATGVTGVAWNAKLMACKFIDANGSGYIEDAIECLQYVKAMKANGVNVVATNNSWGSTGYSQALYDAINDQNDILFVAAAGNDNSSEAFYPAGYDLANIISIAATDEYDRRASFSNYGRWGVDIAAPGRNILSTFPGGSYTTLSGTSMAAPHVAGLAALLKSQNASRTASDLKNLILAGGDTVSSFSDLTVSGKRINAYNSLTCTNAPLFSPLHIPTAPQPWLPVILSAISINCAAPVGPVSVTVTDGSIELLDDGIAPDQTAGDGIFTGIWMPTGTAVETLTFTSPLGTKAISSPPVAIEGQPSIMPGALLLPNSVTSASTGVPFSQTFPISGGIPPYSWSLASGTLPTGLALNSQTGEIAGSATSGGVFPITLQVADSVGMKDRKDWTLLLNHGLRTGWPKELQARVGSGFLPASSSPIVADLDGDGQDEIIVADAHTLYVFYPDGSTRKTILPGQLTTPAVADLDGDGKMEIIVSAGYYYSDRNSIYAFHWDLCPVDGFPAGAYDTVNGGPGQVTSPVVADFNNDGQLEIAVVASPNNTFDPNFDKTLLIMVDSHGQMLPGWPQLTGASDNEDYTPPAVADLFGDGRKELVSAGTDGYVRVWHSDGTLARQWQYGAGLIYAWNPVIADLDGDGFPDIIVKSSDSANANLISAFDRFGTPLPGWPRILPGNVATPIGPIVADLDGDGHPEVIAVAGVSWNELHVLKGNGTYLSGWPTSFQGDAIFDCQPVIGDIDGDGRQEVLVTAVEYPNNGKLLAFTANGAAVTGFPKYTSPATDLRSAAAIGDLDGNGKLDLVVKSEDGYLWAWEMPGQVGIKNLQWPMFRNTPQHTGSQPLFRPLQLTPATFNFGNVLIGATSAAQTFTVSNPHTEPVLVSSITTGGSDAAMFSLSGGTCGSVPFTLAAGQSCTVNVAFAPSAEGSRAATLIIGSSTIGSSAQAPLTGTGQLPAYRLDYTKGGSGEGTVSSSTGTSYILSGSESVATGTVVTLSAAPSFGSTFARWTGCDSVSSNICTVTMDRNRAVYAFFDPIYWSLNASVTTGKGTITPTSTAVRHGGSVTFTITPAADEFVSSFTDNGQSAPLTPAAGNTFTYSLSNVITSHSLAVSFMTPRNVTALAAGSMHTLALLDDGTVWAWGLNTDGQLGNGSTGLINSNPVQVKGLTGVTAIAAGGSNSLALKADGSVWTWGDNTHGQLGDGTTSDRNTPVQVPGMSGVISVRAGASHTIAVKGDGTVWVWGWNQHGQLGNGATTDCTSPVQLTALSGVTSVAAGAYHSLARKSDGTIWAWGNNSSGQIGDGTSGTSRLSPVQVSGLSNVVGLAAGRYHSTALKGDGTVWNWGWDYYGELGDGGSSNRVTPFQVPGLAGVTSLSTQNDFTVALKADGTIWGWGQNDSGELGNGSITHSTPVQAAQLAGVTSVAAGGYHTVVLKDDNTLWSWGYNGYGQLGDGTVVNKLTRSLVQGIGTPMPPVASVVGTPSSPTTQQTATLTVGGSGVVSYRFKLDAGDYSSEVPVGTPIALSSLADGTHIVAIIGKDNIGNWQSTATTTAWNVDTTPPTATITGTPASRTQATSATLTVGGTGVTYYRYKLDDGAYSADTSVYTNITLSNLSEASHAVAVIGKDSAGNWQVDPTTVTWTVDLTPPTAVIGGTPDNPTNAPGATLTISGTDVVSYKYKLDSGNYYGETAVATPIILSSLSDATHTVSVLGKDAAGNWQVTPTVVSWTVDRTPPTAVVTGAPPAQTNTTTATLNVGGSGVLSYKYKVYPDYTYSSEVPSTTAITLMGLSEGSYTVYVLGKDAAGNWQVNPTVVAWTVDLTPPTAGISGVPASLSNSAGATLTIWDVASYKYKLDSGSYSAETAVATPITLTSLSETTHTLSVLGKDAAGNWQLTPTVVSWTVDLTPPAAVISGTPAASTNSTSATLAISGTDVISYKYKLDTGSYSFERTAGTSITLTALSEATHTVSVLGKDSAGNWQVTPTTVSWTVDLTPPAAVISSTPANPTNATGATLGVSGTGVVSYKYKLDSGSYSVETAVATPITLSSLSEATHTVSVLGKDAAGNWQVTPTTVSWTVDRTPPTAVVTGAPPAQTNATNTSLNVGGSGVVSYKYMVSPDNTYSSEMPGATAITLLGLSEGSYTVSVLGKDAAGNWQVSPTVVAWTVDLTPPTAVITGTPAASTNSRIATLAVSGTDVVSYKYKLDTGSYSSELTAATPITLSALSEASHTISVLGKDIAGNWQVTPTIVFWTVDLTPPTAVIAGAPAAPTKSTGATLTVSGTGVISYKYKLDTGTYSPEIAVETPITVTSLGEGTHTVSVLGKDAAGNWQATATAVTWRVDLDITAIAAGSTHTLALLTDGTVWAWGSNFYGELGNGWWHNSYPAQVKGLSGVTAIAAGDSSSLALKADGTVWTWGYNSHGQLGDGTTSDRNTPVQVPGLTGVISIRAGAAHTIAVKGDGSVWVWGGNQYGQLGNGATTDCTSPVQLTALSGVTAVAAGGYYSLARKSDGTIWAWGDNGSGQLGDGTSGGSRLSPGLVPGLSDVVALAAGTGHSTALKGDGTVWNWGANYYGQLGDEGPSPRSTPFQVPGLAGVTSISAGGFSTIALKQDGTVWGWGSNDKGQLGNGAITNSIPVQAAQLSGVTSVAGGGSHTVALRGDNTLWSWGYNAYGEAGDGTTVDRLTRTLVKVIGTPITPLASIAGTPATLTTQTSATLTVGGSGVVSYRYQLDAGDYSPEAPVGTPITLSSLADGTHIVAVIGKDNIGNWQSTPTTTAWNVDSTPPAATLTGTPSSPTRATSATLTVGGAGVTYYRYKLDDGAYSADTYVYTNITLSNLSEGTHTVAVIGKDAAGNWQATPTEVSWKVDTSAPATTASPTGYIVVSGKVSLACSDGAGSGCVTTRYCLGTGCTPATTYSGPITINATTDLRFYSTDAAGNSESVKTAGYTVLASDYAVTVTVSGSGTGSVTSNPAAISATGSASARFAAMATVTLQATPGPYSAFTGWTGACTGVGDCVLSVTADRAATATFAFDTFHSTNTGTGVYNSSIQAALNGSIDNDIIHLWRIEFFEDLIFSQDKKTTISGGYDQNYTAQSGSTILHGALKITNGTVKIDRLTLR